MAQGLITSALQIFFTAASKHKLKFHELMGQLNDDNSSSSGVDSGSNSGSVEDVVMNMQGGPYQEYFYIEVPVGIGASTGAHTRSTLTKRFVYVHDDPTSRFPM